jgi:hypothetical protein
MPGSRRGTESTESQDSQSIQRIAALEAGLDELRGDVTALKGRFDAWDVTVTRMANYQRQMAMLAEELRKLKMATGVDATPDEGAQMMEVEAMASMSMSTSDPPCSRCQKRVAYDMPMHALLQVMTGDTRVNLGDLFNLPAGRVKANSPFKKLVKCSACMESGAPQLVVCSSGGAGNRLMCDWCRCRMTTNTTDAQSGWCGKKHSNCRALCIENETDRQGNTHFLTKGLVPVRACVPWDDVQLIDTGLAEQWNDADYVIVAKSSLAKALIILEIDNRAHAGGGQYSPELESKKNDGNFAAGEGFGKILFIRINPTGAYTTGEGQANPDKRARWLVARDWMACFLRYPFGSWEFGDRTLVYLFYSYESQLIDRRPEAFATVVTDKPPALPEGSPLADWGCSLDPYLVVKGGSVAQQALALEGRAEQPARTASVGM